jgi:predicted transport protein
VDVVPQSKRLRISLNINFQELDDPRKICRDVTGMGRWGNGNTEVLFENMDDLPYIMGLVRQALERQLGDDESEL